MSKTYKAQTVCLLHKPTGQMTPILETDNNPGTWLGCNNAMEDDQLKTWLSSLFKMYGRLSPSEFTLKVVTQPSDGSGS